MKQACVMTVWSVPACESCWEAEAEDCEVMKNLTRLRPCLQKQKGQETVLLDTFKAI